MLISVIIPCYNVEAYIRECIESVINQNYSKTEIICVDNNSTDNTNTILKDLQNQYPSIKIIKEKKAGAPNARNKGLENASGEWVQFLDADDLLMPGKIEHQVNLLKDNGYQNVFISAASWKQDVEGRKTLLLPEKDAWKGLFITRLGNTCANLFNRNALLKINSWGAELKSSQEYDLMFRLLKEVGQPLIDQEPLTIIRERRSGQISQQNPGIKWNQYLSLRLQIYEYLCENQKVYFLKEKNFFMQELFSILRILYPYDNTTSREIFNKYLSKHFKPDPSLVSSRIYCSIFRIIGFDNTEKLNFFLKQKFLHNKFQSALF